MTDNPLLDAVCGSLVMSPVEQLTDEVAALRRYVDDLEKTMQMVHAEHKHAIHVLETRIMKLERG